MRIRGEVRFSPVRGVGRLDIALCNAGLADLGTLRCGEAWIQRFPSLREARFATVRLAGLASKKPEGASPTCSSTLTGADRLDVACVLAPPPRNLMDRNTSASINFEVR
jgi:hypothetical protein